MWIIRIWMFFNIYEVSHTLLIWVRFLGWEDPLEKEMATHSSILTWKISWMEEPGRSMGSQRVSHDWATSLSQNPSSPTRDWTQGYSSGVLTTGLNHSLDILYCQEDPVSTKICASTTIYTFIIFFVHAFIYLTYLWDFLGGPVVKNSCYKKKKKKNSCFQCRGHGFNWWSEKITHAMGQLSLHAATTEACSPLEPVLCNKRSHCNEKPMHCSCRVAPACCN